MINSSIKDYLIQTQQLFGDNLFLTTTNDDFFVISEGNLDSKILFVKESSNNSALNKEEKLLFYKILKALNLSLNDIFLITISEDETNNKFSSFSNQLEPLIIVILGSCISKIFLSNIYKNTNIISTFSLKKIIDDSSCKKFVWKDLKPILGILK